MTEKEAHMEPEAIDIEGQARNQIELAGASSLTVDDLTDKDMDDIPWSGSVNHIKHVREAVKRAAAGEIDYLAVRTPGGKPISIGAIDYAYREGSGYMSQLSTMEQLRGLGVGTRLIQAMEEHILKRGLSVATLGVEDSNPGAKRLYERLGYSVIGPLNDSWEEVDAEGNKSTHYATGEILSKELAPSS